LDKSFYFEQLYPLQDEVLELLTRLDTGLYLTGGTASSRGYLAHRLSDDLDLFANDAGAFGLWADRLIQTLSEGPAWNLKVAQREKRFVRLFVERQQVPLKIELVNDVPSHIGEVRLHPVLGRLDSPENILANKISALVDREEPKDLADIWGFCCRMGLSLEAALENAHSKAAGIFPADVARLLCSATTEDWELIRWIEAPEEKVFRTELQDLGEKLLLG
jgi:hypothetical protein